MPLKNSQYDTIMRMYQERQTRQRYDLNERKEALYLEIPALLQLEHSIAEISSTYALKAIQGDTTASSQLKLKLKDLREEKAALLQVYGHTSAELDLAYDCPICQDTGYVGNEHCHCFKQASIDLLYHQSHLRDVLKNENFDTFSYDYCSEEDFSCVQKIVMECKLFVENFDKDFQNLLFLGAVGTGKTFLSNCIAKELLDTCHSVVYLTAFEFFDLLEKSTFFKGEDSALYKQAYSYIFDCDLLIIDDLGTELTNSFTTSQLFLCLNERILHRKSTVISSNLDAKSLHNIYTERIFSRLTGYYTILPFVGKDIRIKKKLLSNI